jgi:Flp pilus assembly protein TadD
MELSVDRVEEACAALEEADHILPDQEVILRQLAEARMMAGQENEAVDALQRVVARKPDDAQLLNRMAVFLVRAGRLQEAARSYSRALAVDPDLGARPESLLRQLERADMRRELAEIQGLLGGA